MNYSLYEVQREGWENKLLEDIAEINPSHPEKEPKDEDKVSFIPMKAVEELTGNIDTSKEKRWGEVKKGYTRFQEKDVLFAKITPSMENGKTAVAKNLTNGCGAGSTEFHVIRCGENLIPEYLFYFLVQEGFRREAENNMTGTAGHMRVPKEFLEEFELPLPPLEEQKRIVSKIEELLTQLSSGDQSIRSQIKKIEILERSILKRAFSGEISKEFRENNQCKNNEFFKKNKEKFKDRFNKYSRLPDLDLEKPNIPDSWEWKNALELCEDVSDGTHDTPEYYDEGVPLITSKNLKNDDIDFENVKYISEKTHQELESRSGVSNGDVLLAMIGTIGNPVVVNTERKFSIKNVGLFKPDKDCIKPKFLKYWLESPHLEKILEEELLSGTNQKFIPLGNLRMMPVPTTEIEEQNRIVELIESRLSVTKNLKRTLEEESSRSNKLRESILKSAFKGELISQKEKESSDLEISGDKSNETKTTTQTRLN